MNFLSHYHYDKIERGNPLYHLGLVFPDFLKTFTLQRFKANPIKNPTNDIYLGALKHLERDGHFHSHLFFDQMCDRISKIVDSTDAKKIPKTWFLAHIMLEMAIDRIIMEDDIDQLHNFYEELEGVNQKEINKYFIDNNLIKSDVFMEKLTKFTEHKWLFHYLENDMFPKSLNRVYFRIGITEEWNKKIHQSLITCLPEVLAVVREGLKEYS